jgi:hypothetical protein
MSEILFGILEMLLELVLEAAFEFALAYFFTLIWRGVTAVLDTSEPRNPFLACIGCALMGGVVGGISLLFLPHPLFHPSRVHGISLIVSPVLAGLGMSFISSSRKQNRRGAHLESFSYGFAFAFGMALVRFFFTTTAL